ncbi:MLO-like protein 14 isoform X1 [Aegilops tauschii subsp. strangulata]|uniref:MLO-like protein n=2 Tax=Aegilops tauschii subsp. strangulata TaxID=200361 RepID=A0A453DGK4_AEGTS|nr:MLO-like protein 14 isoform X1 [Aegilops tauschii subsp. strangulata]
MAGGEGSSAAGGTGEMRSLALTPTWSVATVLTLLVAASLIVERSIHRLSNWLKKTHRNPLHKAMEKMKEEMMLLGFISLLLAATSRMISGICIDSKYYNSRFSPCNKEEAEESLSTEHDLTRKRNHIIDAILHRSLRRNLKAQSHQVESCHEGFESFVSHEGLEQLHRFIFVMAVTHVTYSCLTMLLAILKVHTWRKWEDEAFRDNHESFSQIAYASATRRQPPALTKSSSFRFWSQNNAVMWVFCFLAQFGQSVVRADYLILRKGFIMNHNLAPTYDFHTYMIRSMEEEFEKIVGVSGVLWGFVVAFMLFNVDGSNLYFWIAILPVALVLLVGAKLQHIIAILTSEGAKLTAFGPRIKPRDDLFWFKKPKFLLWLIHFVLFQNAFELASFFWFWWQFGYESCFIKNHLLVYCRLVLGFAGQFLCSYSTLPVYALVTQMGSKYKAALIPNRIRETMHGWGKDTRKKRKKRRGDDSTIRTETSTVCSLDYEDEDDDGHGHSDDATTPRLPPYLKIELRPMRGGGGIPTPGMPSHQLPTGGSNWTPGGSSQHALLQRQGSASASAPSSPPPSSHGRGVVRSASMPGIAAVATIASTIGLSTPPTRLSDDAHA